MKKIFILMAMVLGSMAHQSQAQVNVNVNIGSQPLWGPVGYDYVEYYYLPDIDAYYSVPRRQYIYNNGGRWVYVNNLPPAYRNYDLYRGYKVVINDPNPWNRHNVYYTKYKPYKGKKNQVIIRDSRDSKYYVVKGHPNYGQAKKAGVQRYPGTRSNGNQSYKGNHAGPGNGKGHGNGHGNNGHGHGKKK